MDVNPTPIDSSAPQFDGVNITWEFTMMRAERSPGLPRLRCERCGLEVQVLAGSSIPSCCGQRMLRTVVFTPAA